MKQLFILSLAFLAITGCRKIETDGEKEIFVVTVTKEVAPVGVVSNTINLSGSITKDTTLYAKDVNYLSGIVYIKNGATLKIEAGAKIQGKFSGSDVGALVITRGAKINAQGTVEKPIVFTSAATNPQSGDWGGIVICGKAPINTSFNSTKGLYEVEGGVNNATGDGLAGSGDAAVPAAIANDNSGVLSYVRIEYAGYAFQPDKEINSLTMACVGSGTKIDHVQVTYAKDDAFEWFGGTVNCKYLIAYKTQDDDFDTDNGFNGKVQFGIVMRDPNIADISTSEAFESDNDATGSANTPITSPVFSNFTVVGPKPTATSPFSSLYRAGAHIRRNTKISIFNTIFVGWPQGILFDNNGTVPVTSNLADTSVNIRYNTFAGNYDAAGVIKSITQSSTSPAYAVLDWVKTTNFNNIEISTTDAKLMQPFSFTAPDFTPYGNETNSTTAPRTLVTWGNGQHVNYAVVKNSTTGAITWPGNGNFDHPLLKDASLTAVTFRGAVNPAGDENQNWWKGWTSWK
jgi:hypothetical protein